MCGTDLIKQFLRALCYVWFAPVKIYKDSKLHSLVVPGHSMHYV